MDCKTKEQSLSRRSRFSFIRLTFPFFGVRFDTLYKWVQIFISFGRVIACNILIWYMCSSLFMIRVVNVYSLSLCSSNEHGMSKSVFGYWKSLTLLHSPLLSFSLYCFFMLNKKFSFFLCFYSGAGVKYVHKLYLDFSFSVSLVRIYSIGSIYDATKTADWTAWEQKNESTYDVWEKSTYKIAIKPK